MDSEDFALFSRNEPLHLLLNVLAENHEEDELLSSKLRTQREFSPGSISIQFLLSMVTLFLVKSQQVFFFVVLLLPLIGMQNPSHPILTYILRAELLEFPAQCCLNPS